MFRAGSTVEVTLCFHPAARWCFVFLVYIIFCSSFVFFCCKCFKVLNGCIIYLEIKKVNIFLPNPVPFVKTEKGMEIYKNLTIGNFGTLSWILGMKFGLSSTNPYNKYCPTVQTKLESRKAEFANIIFGQKGENKTRKGQGVYTTYLS